MNGVGSEVLIILALILANGFFALSELALVSARRSNLEEMKERGKKSARRALRLIDQPERVLASVQVGITVVGTLASVYGGATVVEYLTPYLAAAPISIVADHANGFAVALVVIAISFLSITVGELAPKYLALAHAERIAAGVSWPMTQLTRMLRFVTPVFSVFARGIVRLFGVREVKPSSVVSEMDVRLLLAEGRESGVFDSDEEEIVRSALDFADTTAREALTPRADIVGFEVNTPFEEMFETIVEEGYSRYPIYEGSLDKIIGLVFLKDIVQRKQRRRTVSLNDVMRKPLFVPDSMELAELLRLMQRKRQHMAVCLDDFGGTAGIITLEDILEEIVGEIQDETDVEVAEFSAQSDRVAFISGTLRPDQLNERFGAHLPEDQSATVAGLVVSALGRIPAKQEKVRLDGLTVTVLERVGSRIVRMRVEKQPAVDIER